MRTLLNEELSFNKANCIAQVLQDIAKNHPSELIVWHNELVTNVVDFNLIPSLFHHDKIMMSYNSSDDNFLNEAIGFIELSLYIKVNKKAKYPTWQMSSCVGGVYAAIINSLASNIIYDVDFDYFLNSLAKLAMPLGLFCYSEPKLLKEKIQIQNSSSNLSTSFKFVKQHYKKEWIFLLLLNLLIYDKKLALVPFLRGLFYSRRILNTTVFNAIKVNSKIEKKNINTIDVLIPTIGRKKYLYDVLKDLSAQTILPNNVIIVEQNPQENSTSELDYLSNQNWPFKIIHTFIHQSGACNARNLALKQVTSNWVFFADDDIRFEKEFLNNCLENVEKYNLKAITLACLREKNEAKTGFPMQWSGFGSGCSFVKKEALKGLEFDMRYEFGFGEDSEFGMQLRNNGTDIVYFHSPTLLHLKAPIGGFRTKYVQLWDNETIKPKPSPTVLLFEKSKKSRTQVLGYKTVLFLKYYRRQKIKNPILYLKMFKKQWAISEYWAEKLQTNS